MSTGDWSLTVANRYLPVYALHRGQQRRPFDPLVDMIYVRCSAHSNTNINHQVPFPVPPIAACRPINVCRSLNRRTCSPRLERVPYPMSSTDTIRQCLPTDRPGRERRSQSLAELRGEPTFPHSLASLSSVKESQATRCASKMRTPYA